MTIVLYLIGKAGAGKYTIAREFLECGYAIVDNHLINNPIFSLLNLDGVTSIPDFAWKAIEGIRKSVLDFMSQEKDNNYVLTNELYDDENDCMLYHQVVEMACQRQSVFIPVKLFISEEENRKRIQNPERALRYKANKVDEQYLQHPLIQISHPNLLEIDITDLSAKAAIERILSHIDVIVGVRK